MHVSGTYGTGQLGRGRSECCGRKCPKTGRNAARTQRLHAGHGGRAELAEPAGQTFPCRASAGNCGPDGCGPLAAPRSSPGKPQGGSAQESQGGESEIASAKRSAGAGGGAIDAGACSTPHDLRRIRPRRRRARACPSARRRTFLTPCHGESCASPFQGNIIINWMYIKLKTSVTHFRVRIIWKKNAPPWVGLQIP